MTKLVINKILAACAIIVGVDLVLFLALQSSVFGDPLARETNFSNSSIELSMAAQRLGIIEGSGHGVLDFNIVNEDLGPYRISLGESFEIKNVQQQTVFSTAAPQTISELTTAINQSGFVTASLKEPDFGARNCIDIDLDAFNFEVDVSWQKPFTATVINRIHPVKRFVSSFTRLVQFDLGFDRMSRPIGETLFTRGARSLAIAAPSFFIIFLGAFLLAASSHERKRLSRLLNFLAITCMSLPALLWIFIIRQTVVIDLEWAPLRAFSEPILPLFVLPILITIFIGIWPEYLLMRSFIDDRMKQPFMLAAKAQGITPQRLWWRHLLPNLAGPLAQHVALNLPFLVLGSLLLETIFNIPGLGISIVEAIQNHDSNMIRVITFFIAIIFLIMQAAATLVARRYDPRQRSEVEE